MCCVWKTKILKLFVANLGIFCIQQELSKSKSDLILFKKVSHKSKSLSKWVTILKSFPANFSKKFV